MIEIVPAIDLINGKCVRLTQGDYTTSKQYGNPVEMALRFEGAGLRRLHLVDLDGARQKHVVNLPVLEAIAKQTSLHIDFGGGVQSNADLKRVLDAGARQVTGGSVAVKQPELFQGWLQQYGAEKIILGADARNGLIAVSGWEEATELEINDFIARYIKKGVRQVISTDVARDGLLQGPSFDLYQQLQTAFPDLYIIASGGIASIDDIARLEAMGIPAVIVGKAIYEGRVTLEALTKFIQ